MEKKTLNLYYTTILNLEENEVVYRFLSSLEEKIRELEGIGHKVDCIIDIFEKQVTALFDDKINIIARITNNNVRLE